MGDDAAKFWSDFEAETGEKVEAKAIGTYYERGGDSQGLWGLLVLTDSSFRFRHFPSQNWLASLFRGNRPQEAPATALEIVVPRRDIVAVRTPKRGFFARVFGPAFPRFELAWREGEAERSESFSADPSSDVLRLIKESLGAGSHRK